MVLVAMPAVTWCHDAEQQTQQQKLESIYVTKAVIFLAVMTVQIRLRKTCRENSLFCCEQNLHPNRFYINNIFEVLLCSV